MEKSCYKEKIIDGLRNLGLEIKNEKLEKLLVYMDFLVEYNKKVNLTAIRDKNEIILKHFIDSLAIVNYLEIKKDFRVIDIGTGAGFPGVPIKIFCPEIKIDLLDATEKKIRFLEKLKRELDLKEIRCINMRAEDFIKKEGIRESYDLCVSRAVAKLNVLSEICLPFVKLNGIFVSYKGNEVEEEILKAREGIKKLGGGEIKIKEVDIFDNEKKNFIRHKLIFIGKLLQSDIKYPREYVKILKKPL